MAELRNIDWGRFTRGLFEKDAFSSLLKSRSLQWWLTRGFRQQGYLLLDDLDNLVLEYKGAKFYPDTLNYPRMFESWDRYRIDLLREDDIVLDIGVNIGSFTIPAGQRCKKVVAVEPMFWRGLEKNIELNNLTNVEVIRKAVGGTTETFVEVDCQEYKKSCPSIDPTLSLKNYGPFSVVRLDCGGAERLIDPDEWREVRQWEIEFHNWDKKMRFGEVLWEEWRDFLDEEFKGQYTARWSKRRHWLYLSAHKGVAGLGEVQLRDGSFKGESLRLWREQPQ